MLKLIGRHMAKAARRRPLKRPEIPYHAVPAVKRLAYVPCGKAR
jgi:hypothetical protein